MSVFPTGATMAPADFCQLPNASAYSQALALAFLQTPTQSLTRSQTPSQTQTPSTTPSQTQTQTASLSPVSSWTIITWAGTTGIASYSGNGAPATLATLNNPCFVAYNATSGAVLVAEFSSNVVRVISSSGTISALSTAFSGPDGIAVSADGSSVVVAEYTTGRVKSVSPSGASVTLAGGGALAPDGFPATSVTLGPNIAGVTTDALAGFYVASYSAHVVVYVNSSGVAVRFAGSVNTPGYSGDGAAARAAKLYGPQHAVVDSVAAGVFITDYMNHVVRYVSFTTGNISTVAGNGVLGYSGGEFLECLRCNRVEAHSLRASPSPPPPHACTDGGPATSSKLYNPICVAPDAATGGYFVSDYGAHVIRFVNAGGVIMTIAGTGSAGSAGDNGAATSAQLNGPQGIVLVPGSRGLFVSDRSNSLIRYLCIVCPASATSSQTRSQSRTQTVTGTQSQTVSGAPFNYQIQTFAGRGGTSGTAGECCRGGMPITTLRVSCFVPAHSYTLHVCVQATWARPLRHSSMGHSASSWTDKVAS